MSGALETVQRQLVARLKAHAALMDLVSGIFDGPPPRAIFPYIALARLHRLMALVEEALEAGLEDVPGWQIVTFDFRRTRVLRNATAPWSGLVEYRARVLRV